MSIVALGRGGSRLTGSAGSRVLLAVLTLVASPFLAAAEAHPGNAVCLRCHAMETLAYRDAHTLEIVSLSVDPAGFAGSVHGKLACAKCHQADYRRYPHPERADPKPMSCVGCHEKAPPDSAYPLKTIESEYRRSAHVAPGARDAARFSCHSCHDPHAFRVSRLGTPLTQVVRDDNAVCAACHADLLEPGSPVHAWLPKPQAHWGAVRCLECHTPAPDDAATPGRVSHRILPKAEGVRDCVKCHSRDTRLMDRLYRYRSEEDLARRGLLAKAIFNDAYVVGMSRNPALDALSLVIIALTLLGLTAHGLGRYLVHRRGRRQP